jgi:uncharacterized protein (TIGR02271 family)
MQLSQELHRDFVAPALGTVTGEGGWLGRVYPAASETRDGFVIERVLIRPDDNGPALVVPRDLLQAENGGFRLPLARRAAEAYVAGPTDLEEARLQSGERIVVPVAEEYISIGKRLVETGNGVRITKTVQSRNEVIEQPVLRERVTVERVSKNEVVSATPVQREEGDVLIVPVVEEVLVVEKRLLLREELHIRRVREQATDRQTVTLRREEVHVEPLSGARSQVNASSPQNAVNPQAT